MTVTIKRRIYLIERLISCYTIKKKRMTGKGKSVGLTAQIDTSEKEILPVLNLIFDYIYSTISKKQVFM